MNVLITGGAGFIGSCFARTAALEKADWNCVVLDKLTYAGSETNLEPVSDKVTFVKGDIADTDLLNRLFQKYEFRVVVNFAAETHVDRSIKNPEAFITNDIIGAYRLLEVCKSYDLDQFVQISTDEVYGEVLEGFSVETDPLMPRNPYSASKCASDRLAFSYFATYDLPVVISRCSNNYGPYQHPEKLIPLFVTRLMEGKKVPLYGDGMNIRDWLYVEDHVRAIFCLIDKAEIGEVYNISANEEHVNKEITHMILEEMSLGLERIEYVEDRVGHDRRYSMNSQKIRDLGWKPRYSFQESFSKTVQWYRQNESWWKSL
ncbi:dTDP-glucose 4,6-dehydratase [PVC group bacterium (ex Bugula neritina AB1)]|nr:dTDP-glucose 4,6-dehydratase [PVC group bacterium (ex Bugula neritina AB1)]